MSGDLTEYPAWNKNVPSTGVTFNGECAMCGFRLENKVLLSGRVEIEGDGVRIARVRRHRCIDGRSYTSDDYTLACSGCVPAIKGGGAQ